MAKKKGKARRAARRAKVIIKRASPRGGRLMSMFKTVAAVTGAAIVGGAAINMINSARKEPATGWQAGAITFGGGALLAFLLGMFKGTRQYVTPVLAGAAAVGGLSALQGPITRGSSSIANALLGRTTDRESIFTPAEKKALGLPASTSAGYGPGYVPLRQGGQGFTGATTTSAAAGPRQQQVKGPSKGQAIITTAGQLADLGASIAGAFGGRGGVAAAAGDGGMDGSEGLDDYTIGSGRQGFEEEEMDGSEGLDDFAIAGAAYLDD